MKLTLLVGVIILSLVANGQVLRDEDIDDTSDMDPNDADYKDHNHRDDDHDIRRFGPYRNGNANGRRTPQHNTYDDTDLDHSQHDHKHLSSSHGVILLPAVLTSMLWVFYSIYMVL